MANDIPIKKTVYNKTDFSRVIGAQFTTFTQPLPEEDTDTEEELFRLYEKFFYEIDVEGEENSHEYLVRRSSELVTADTISDETQLLIDEITQLRRENLDFRRQILDLESKQN